MNRTVNSTYSSLSRDIEYREYYLRPETYFGPVLFCLIFVTGLIGNGTLILIFIRHRSMRSIPNTYILSLALGDILVIGISVPFVSTIYTFENWPYGSVVCKMSEFFRDVSSSVTVYTLVALSIERYNVVVNNIRTRISGSKRASTLITATLIWIVSIWISVPTVIFSEAVDILQGRNDTNSSLIVCYPFPLGKWPWYPKMITMLRFIFLYVIPVITIAPFYIILSKYLMTTSKNGIGEKTRPRWTLRRQATLGQSKQLKARKKVAKLVLALFFLFLISFLPNHVFMIWFYYNSNSQDEYNDFWHYFRIVGFLLMFANSCMNPIALYCLSAVFRRHFNNYIFFCGKRRNHNFNTSPNHCNNNRSGGSKRSNNFGKKAVKKHDTSTSHVSVL